MNDKNTDIWFGLVMNNEKSEINFKLISFIKMKCFFKILNIK